jgi:hypothetical protein
MATLTEDVKLFIVHALACFDTPSEVAEAVKEEFGITIERMQAQKYDPTKALGKDLGKKYKAIFEATREKFLTDVGSIPIANQTFRLRSLQKIHDKSIKGGNRVLAAQILEQVAKEVGGNFTNKIKADVNHAGKVDHTHAIINLTGVTKNEPAEPVSSK